MGFFDDIKKKLEGGIAQANPFDHGATYNTVVNNQPVPTPKPAASATVAPARLPNALPPRFAQPSQSSLPAFKSFITPGPVKIGDLNVNNPIAQPQGQAPAPPGASILHDVTHNPVTNFVGNTIKGEIQDVPNSPVANALKLGIARFTNNQQAQQNAATQLSKPFTQPRQPLMITQNGRQVINPGPAKQILGLANGVGEGAPIRDVPDPLPPKVLVNKQQPIVAKVAPPSTHSISTELASPNSLSPEGEANVLTQHPHQSNIDYSGTGQDANQATANARLKPVAELTQSRPVQNTSSLEKFSSTNSTPELPTINTKSVPLRDLAFRSTRSIIERQGEHGQTLAGMLQGARDAEEIYQGQLAKQLPTVRSLKGKDFENFVDATQGLTKAKSPKIEKAIAEWQAVHPSIRNRAVAAGLDVGDLGPKYYPHFIDYEKVFKDKNTYNAAINHLVKTGQASSNEEAIRLLGYARATSRNRTFGNLESSRQIELPFYDKTPNSLKSYISGSTKRIANTETFGKNDEKALKLISKAGVQGHDTEAMKNAFDIAVGAKRYGSTATKFLNAARGYQSTTRLGLGALTNATQNINTGIVAGHLRTLGSMVKQLNPKTRSFVQDTGTISDAVLNDLKTQAGYVGKGLGHITAPGFAKVETFNRSVAATAGRDYALRLAQKGDEKTLRKLGVTGDIKDKTLSHEQQIQAARKMVEKTQFKVDPQDLPGWADSPGGKLVSQFRTFSYAQGKFFSNEILKPAAKGNLLPLSRLLAALPVGYAMYGLKQHIAGRPLDPSKARQGLEAFGNTGGAGLAIDIFRGLVPLNGAYLTPDRFTSMAAGTLGGPTVGGVVDLAGGAVQAIQKKNLPQNPADLQGKAAIVSGDGYYDPTTLARFGLRQIPIAGTAIQNRILPYQPKTSLNKDQQEQLSDMPKDQQAAFIKNIQDQKAVASQTLKDKATAAYRVSKGGSSGLSAVDELAVDKKKQSQLLKNSLNPEDYKLSILSKVDRQKLIDSGKYTQAKFDGLDNYVKNEKSKLGIASTPAGVSLAKNLDSSSKSILTRYSAMSAADKTKAFNTTPSAEYQYAQAKYNNDKANGTLSAAQDITTQKSLAKAKVGADYSKNVRDLYGLSKAELNDYLSTDDGKTDKQTLYSQLQAYDSALYKAGLITTPKLKYGLSSGKSGGSSTGKKLTAADFKSTAPSLSGLTKLLDSTAASPTSRKKVSVPTIVHAIQAPHPSTSGFADIAKNKALLKQLLNS